MTERIKSLLVYTGKCVTGTLIIFLLAALLQYKDYGWGLISVILVLSPDGKDTFALAFTRIKANLVGAAAGFICLFIGPTNMWTMSLAVSLTLSACYALKLDDGMRSAMAAAIIIMLHEEGKHVWDTALERVLSVLAGCLIGLLITYIFHFRSKPSEKIKATDKGEA